MPRPVSDAPYFGAGIYGSPVRFLAIFDRFFSKNEKRPSG
jgi:hypothetical protein